MTTNTLNDSLISFSKASLLSEVQSFKHQSLSLKKYIYTTGAFSFHLKITFIAISDESKNYLRGFVASKLHAGENVRFKLPENIYI